MKNVDLVRRIAEELDHIPRGERHSPQNVLRMLYNLHRRQELAKRPDAHPKYSLLRAIIGTQNEYPYFVPSVDQTFFGIRGARWLS